MLAGPPLRLSASWLEPAKACQRRAHGERGPSAPDRGGLSSADDAVEWGSDHRVTQVRTGEAAAMGGGRTLEATASEAARKLDCHPFTAAACLVTKRTGLDLWSRASLDSWSRNEGPLLVRTSLATSGRGWTAVQDGGEGAAGRPARHAHGHETAAGIACPGAVAVAPCHGAGRAELCVSRLCEPWTRRSCRCFENSLGACRLAHG